MSSLERLPPDQRAVLALVLQRGRSYDEIADLLAIDRAAVRDRALAALDALGPSESSVSPERRALITDYLLGQLPPRVRDDTRERLARSPSERAWARMLASELAPMSSEPLPEIPAAPAPEPPEASEPAATPGPADGSEPPAVPPPTPEPTREPTRRGAAEPVGAAPASPTSGRPLPRPVPVQRASSRLGGGALLGIALLILVVVVVIILVSNNSSSNKPHRTQANTTPTTTTTGTHTGTTTGTSTTIHPVGPEIIMKPASGSPKARGVAEVVTQGKVTGVIVAADHLVPNTKHNAYAVWLAAPGGPYHLLGYVSPGVGSKGALKTSGPLPANASRYKEILITLETTTNTKTPGQTVLAGTL